MINACLPLPILHTQALRPHVLQPEGPGLRVQLPPLAQQAEQQATPAAAPCLGEHTAVCATGVAAGAMQQAAPVQGQHGAQAPAEAHPLVDAPAATAAGANQPLLLRMEPMEGCLTTCEAGAAAAAVLPPLLLCAGCQCPVVACARRVAQAKQLCRCGQLQTAAGTCPSPPPWLLCAVARALGALEGAAVRDAILRPLAQLARFQVQKYDFF